MSGLGPKDHMLTRCALEESADHQSDDVRGGCTCGFCVWSQDHLALMVASRVERSMMGSDPNIPKTDDDQARAVIADLQTQLAACREALARIGDAVVRARSAREAHLAVLAVLNPPEEP